MRVLMLVNTLPPTDVSGVGEQVLQLATGLREAGHEVEVLGRGAGGVVGAKLLFPLGVLPAFRSTLRRLRPHVVQVHESDGALAALALKVVGPLLHPPPFLVALLQVSYVEEMRAVRPLRAGGRVLGLPGPGEKVFRYLKAPIQVVLGCLTAWLADLVLAPSRTTAQEIERDYGVRGVEVLPNVTCSRVAEPGPQMASSETGEYLLFVGRLRIRKGVEILLEALGRLAGELPDLRLLIVGDGERRRALEATMRRLELEGRVDFLGRCDAGRVRQLLRGARALVVPSIYEGMPVVALEAMESGVPVVASAVSGIPEVVEDGRTGWLVPPEEPVALAEALLEVWRRPDEARRRGVEGRHKLERSLRPEVAARLWGQAVRSRLPRAGASKAVVEGDME